MRSITLAAECFKLSHDKRKISVSDIKKKQVKKNNSYNNNSYTTTNKRIIEDDGKVPSGFLLFIISVFLFLFFYLFHSNKL